VSSSTVIASVHVWLRSGSAALLLCVTVFLQAQLLEPAAVAARASIPLVVGDGPGEYSSIQSAIDAAVDSDSILISSGIWQENIDLRGKAITLAPLDLEVVIDGGGIGTVITCASGENANTIIEGLVIRGGFADRGAGLLTRNSSPIIRDCIFEANESSRDGAIWRGEGGGPTFMDCVFIGNSAGEGEAFAACNGCTPLVINCRFVGNCPQPKINDWMLASGMNIVDPMADTCGQAIELTEGLTPFATICAASERPGHAECELEGDGGIIANDIWYRYIPESTGLLRLSTCQWSDFDTDLAVYRGNCDELELIGCNDDAPDCPGGPSQLMLPVRAGIEYLIRLGGGVEGASGRGFLEVQLNPTVGRLKSRTGGDPNQLRGAGWLDVCPSCAYTTIQSAVDAADETIFGVYIEAGTYFENLTIRTPITLFGDPEGVYIDGGLNPQHGPVITTGSHGGVLVLDGLTIMHGWNEFNPNAGTNGIGGGICIDSFADGDLIKINNCSIIGNVAREGAGIGQHEVNTGDAPDLIILDSQINLNTAIQGGLAGGIYGHYRRCAIDRSEVLRNRGVGFIASTVEFNHIRRSNISYNEIGGLQMLGANDMGIGTTVLDNCLVIGNNGYGAYMEGNTDVTHCTFAYNRDTAGIGGLSHDGRVSNSIFWGNSLDGLRSEFAQVNPQSNIWNSIIDQYSGDGTNNLTGLDPMFVDPNGGDGVPGVCHGALDEEYSLLPGSPAIDAGNTPTDIEYSNSYLWLNPYTYEIEYAGAIDAFNECYDWDADGVDECFQHLHNDDIFDSPLGIPWEGLYGDIGCYEYLNTHSMIRYFVWSNMVQGSMVLDWSHPFNWHNYDFDWVFPNDPLHSVILTTDQMPYEQPYSPTGINYTIRDLIIGPGDWNFDASSTRVESAHDTLIGTFSGGEPAHLTLSDGFELETLRLLIDGVGQGQLRVTDAGSNINFWDKAQLVRGGTLHIDQGGTARSDAGSGGPGGGSIFNLGGILEVGDGTIDAKYVQYGTLPLPNYATEFVSGTLVLHPGQTPDFNHEITLGGTVIIDFTGQNVQRGSTYELLRFQGGSTRNTGIQCTGLPSNTFLRVRREAGTRGAAEVLIGEVTTVDEIFGLNEGTESGIDSVPTDAKLGDVDADGDLDLAFTLPGATELNDGNFIVLLNEGDADNDTIWDGFESTASMTYIVGREPMAVALGDHAANGGALDAIIANKESGSVTLITDIPAGAPATELVLDSSGGLDPDPVDVCFFDVEGNGRLDIIVASEGDATLRLIENTGTRRGSRIDAGDDVIHQPDAPPWGVDPGEEGDSKDDAAVVVISRQSNKSTLFGRPQALRAFTLEVNSIVLTETQPVDMAMGNFDNDDDDVSDSLIINQAGNSFQVLLRSDDDGDGFPEFLGASTFELSPGTFNPQSVGTGDFDNDGDIDVAIVMTETVGGTDQVITRVWRNDLIYEGVESELLTFTDTFTNLPSTGEPILVVAGDVDNVGGSSEQIGADAVILSSSSGLRGPGNFVTPNVGGPVTIDNVTDFISVFKDAQDGDTIVLAGGTYALTGQLDFTDRDLIIIGAIDDNGAPLTTIVASGATRAIWMAGGQTDGTRLENLIIEGGPKGGGIYMENTANPGPWLSNCIIRNCNWHDHGAGLRLNNAHPHLEHCSVHSCTAAQRGGGAYIYNGGNMTATDSDFTSNHAGDGGAFLIFDNSSVNLAECHIESNQATEYGGAVFVRIDAQLNCNNVTFRANSNINSGFNGGAITSYGGIITLTNTTLDGNAATQGGGAIAAWNGGSLELDACTLAGNFAMAGSGGGLYSNGSVLVTIHDSLICSNTPSQIYGPWSDLGGNCIIDVCDTDGDGTADCNDGCPDDPDKIDPGQCGCGVADTDTDGDGTADCNDGCPDDPDKIDPGQCGCGVADTDTDGDGIADCVDDACPADLDGDHDVDVTDLLAVIAAWGDCDDAEPCPADINDSGDVNVMDLLEVIAAWGECPGDLLFAGCTDNADADEANYGCACFMDGDDSSTDCNAGLNGDGSMTPYELGDVVCGAAPVFLNDEGNLLRDTDWWDADGMLDDGGTFSLEIGAHATQILGIVDLDAVAFVDYVVNEPGLYSPPADVTLSSGSYCIWVGPSDWNTDWTCESGLADYVFSVTD
jgi:hypothetical protein